MPEDHVQASWQVLRSGLRLPNCFPDCTAWSEFGTLITQHPLECSVPFFLLHGYRTMCFLFSSWIARPLILQAHLSCHLPPTLPGDGFPATMGAR